MHYIDKDWLAPSIALDLISSKGLRSGKDIAKTFYDCLIYNLKEKLLYGITSQTITSKTKDEEDRHKDINYKEEKYNTNFMYQNGKGQESDSNLDVSPVKLIFNRLQGVGNLKLKAGDNRKNLMNQIQLDLL